MRAGKHKKLIMPFLHRLNNLCVQNRAEVSITGSDGYGQGARINIEYDWTVRPEDYDTAQMIMASAKERFCEHTRTDKAAVREWDEVWPFDA